MQQASRKKSSPPSTKVKKTPKVKTYHAHFNARDPKVLKDFLSVFAARVPEEDLRGMKPDVLAEVIRNHWTLSAARKAGKPAIQIYTIHTGGVGADATRTAIDIVYDDMPFLVDSVTAELARQSRLIHSLIHPIIHVKRDKGGALSAFESHVEKDGDYSAQSHMHIELQGTVPVNLHQALRDDLARVLGDVNIATSDWLAMRERLQAARTALLAAKVKASKDDVAEYAAFLNYLYHDNFTLLGYREYKFTQKGAAIQSTIIEKSGLGLLRDKNVSVYTSGENAKLDQTMQQARMKLPPVFISKVNRRATVHRAVPMDAISVKLYDKDGKVSGEAVFMGLFTSVTYSRSIQDIPLLRRKAEMVMQRTAFRPGSHDYKAIRHILEKYPRDELFQIGLDRLVQTALGILQLQERLRIALFTRADTFARYISALVYVPRDRYDTGLRVAMQKILERELNGTVENFYTTLDDSPLARVMYSVQIHGANIPQFKTEAIEAKLQEAGRAWSERLLSALRELKDSEDEIAVLSQRYGAAFPASYCENYEPKQAVYDIDKIETLLDDGRMVLDLYCDKSCGNGQMRLKMYNRGQPIVLSDALPVLENMGMRVISELPFEVTPEHAEASVWIHDILIETRSGKGAEQIDAVKDKFEQALLRVWYGDMENDGLNELVIAAQMEWRNIVALRGYVRYLRQARFPFGIRSIESTLTRNAEITRQLSELFQIRFDPARDKGRDAAMRKCEAKIGALLNNVASLDEDRVIRAMLTLLTNTLRTNFYQKNAVGDVKPYVSYKLDSGAIDFLPAPRPFREIYVYSRRMEGVHLRGDWIARGGIRWSDRQEDFRTEVLGLLKAQQVKNAVIVPMGAKGGFVVKNPPKEGGREAFMREGIECYRTLIRGMLDITDNRKGTKVVAPADVVRHDVEDPYLVAAADKGTATFSDIANGLSLDYGFWLGDAFASGGSAGYDHKKMGITARGAWESVKRHFREIGHDTQTQEFDVVGVGDMGGDVFGNGMLLSEKIRLVGAFNHLHIFCDPSPDAAKSFKERKRLFNEVKGWDHYDTQILSKGGRIFNRSEKSLQLTPEIMARFGLERDKVTPSELILAMLRAETDLLWFGGIGTYIKAEEESHADVGDKANDDFRINGGEVRARVIGEGANLAMTQLGRIEYALTGGRLNADFIDNSGGVDSSDNEVNIKIMLVDVMEHDKSMTLAKRNRLLESMTDEVAALVLEHNYQQTQGLSMAERGALENLGVHAQFIRYLVKNENLSRKLEGLPDEEEIERRRTVGKALTRPELCILLSYSKMLLARDLLATDIPDAKEMAPWLINYFPTALRKKYADSIGRHRLRREIVATMLASEMVNRMGPTFVWTIANMTGANIGDIARAYLIARESFGLPDLWKRIEALDGKITADAQMRMMQEIVLLVERAVTWFLTRLNRTPNIAGDVKIFAEGVQGLRAQMGKVLTENGRALLKERSDAGVRDGLPAELAQRMATVPMLGAACDIIRIALDRKTPIADTAGIYYALGERLHIDWLRHQASFIPANDRWSAEARDGLIEQLYNAQAALTHRVLQDVSAKKRGDANGKAAMGAVQIWMDGNAQTTQQLGPLLDDMQKSGALDIPMLMIAEQKLRQLSGA